VPGDLALVVCFAPRLGRKLYPRLERKLQLIIAHLGGSRKAVSGQRAEQSGAWALVRWLGWSRP